MKRKVHPSESYCVVSLWFLASPIMGSFLCLIPSVFFIPYLSIYAGFPLEEGGFVASIYGFSAKFVVTPLMALIDMVWPDSWRFPSKFVEYFLLSLGSISGAYILRRIILIVQVKSAKEDILLPEFHVMISFLDGVALLFLLLFPPLFIVFLILAMVHRLRLFEISRDVYILEYAWANARLLTLGAYVGSLFTFLALADRFTSWDYRSEFERLLW